MNKAFSAIVIAIGFFIIVYFGYIFIVFSSSENPIIWPFVAQPILLSIIFVCLGLILLIIGFISLFKIKSKNTDT